MDPSSLKAEIRSLRNQIQAIRKEKAPNAAEWVGTRTQFDFPPVDPLKLKKSITHVPNVDGFISFVDCGVGMDYLTLSAGARGTGNTLIWDMNTYKRKKFIKSNYTWALTARLEKSVGDLVGISLLDGAYVVYRLKDQLVVDQNDKSFMQGHEAAVSDFRFIGRDKAVTAGADQKLKLWDIRREASISTLIGHTSDVLSVDTTPKEPNLIISGGSDSSARLWDIRKSHQKKGSFNAFDTKSHDVNSVAFFPDGNAFAAALSNSQTHFYDIRASCKMLTFSSEETFQRTATEMVTFSPSGRLMFVLYADGTLLAYDVTATPVENHAFGAVVGARQYRVPGLVNAKCFSMQSEGMFLAVNDEQRNGAYCISKFFWPSPGRR